MNQFTQGHRQLRADLGVPGDMFQPGRWDKDEVISGGPIRNPGSGEIGQGKEIGGQEVTWTRGPKNHGQNLRGIRQCLQDWTLPVSRSAAPLVYNSHRAKCQGEKTWGFFYSSSSSQF